ncbi:hypothetical protein DENSPDRAFT_879477 [Dentipellis sp. KUC8613]|nr:hypothetical protein DENSPDRAFT_879477 [Dentipellis sp. KUC8613]
MSAPAAAIPSLNDTMGVTFIGVILAAVYVFTVWACDTVHQILITHAIYTYLVTNYFNPVFLNTLEWSIIVEVLFNSFTAIIVQTFFVMRIFTLSNKNYFFVVPVMIMVIAQFVAYLVYVTKALQMDTFVPQLATLKNLTLSINAITAATDVAIAAILCSLLHGSRTGFRRSDTMINKLMLWTVNTGLLTSVDAALALATHAALPSTFVYICFFFLLGRLYSNSLLGTLNARKTIRPDTSQDESISLGIGFSRSRATTGAVHPSGQNGIAINVNMTKEYSKDPENQFASHSHPESQLDAKVDPQSFHEAL